jgi:RHS repeat-associated protein
VITYGYTNGKITGISVNGTVLVSDILYDPFGPVRQWTWGNGSLAVRTFDQDGKIAQIDSAGLKTYSYDDAFRITGITDTSDPALSWTYGYDDLDRLTNASKTGTTLGYTYDANGNRLAETGSNPSTFTIAANSNRLASTSGTLSRTYGYDDAGNATSFTGVSFTYNNRGRMKSSTKDGATTNYVYNALGQLVKKGSTALYYYDEAGHILGIYDGTGALTEEIAWLGDIPIATLRPNGGGIDIYYIHTDHLNTPRLATGSVNPDVRWRWDGDPFGGGAINDNPSGAGVFEFNLRFPGQLAIAETGLYYNYFRDYDPATGRYVQSDPIGLIDGPNTYAYTRNAPTMGWDSLGLMSDQSCCDQSMALGQNGSSQGWIVCCEGRKVACYVNSRPPNHAALAIERKCTIEHERAHWNEVPCTSCTATPTRPDRYPGIDRNASECAAHRVSLQCMRRGVVECGTDSKCRDYIKSAIEAEMRVARRRYGCRL